MEVITGTGYAGLGGLSIRDQPNKPFQVINDMPVVFFGVAVLEISPGKFALLL